MAHLVRIKVFDRRWPSKGLRIYRLSGKVSFRMQQISGCCASGQYQSGQDGLQVQGQLLHHLAMWNKLKWIFKKWAHLDKDEQKNNIKQSASTMLGNAGVPWFWKSSSYSKSQGGIYARNFACTTNDLLRKLPMKNIFRRSPLDVQHVQCASGSGGIDPLKFGFGWGSKSAKLRRTHRMPQFWATKVRVFQIAGLCFPKTTQVHPPASERLRQVFFDLKSHETVRCSLFSWLQSPAGSASHSKLCSL